MKKSKSGLRIFTILLLIIAIIGGGAWFLHNQSVKNEARIAAQKKEEQKQKAADAKKLEAKHLKEDPIYKAYKDYGLTYKMTQNAQTLEITAIGDSVMLGSEYGLKEIFPNIDIDATVSRQAYQGSEIIKAKKEQGSLSDTIVIGLGTNGTITKDDIKNVMQAAGKKRQVYWISVNVDQPWEAGDNKELKAASKRYKNFHIIDWKKFAKEKGDSSWFSADGIHPSVKGQAYYYTLIAREILK